MNIQIFQNGCRMVKIFLDKTFYKQNNLWLYTGVNDTPFRPVIIISTVAREKITTGAFSIPGGFISSHWILNKYRLIIDYLEQLYQYVK